MRVTRFNMMLPVFGLILLMAGCIGVPLADYQSRNRSEAEIKAVLLEGPEAALDIQKKDNHFEKYGVCNVSYAA